MKDPRNSLINQILVCFFPVWYFSNQSDRTEWEALHQKEYATFLRIAAIGACIVCITLYVVLDRQLYQGSGNEDRYSGSVLYRVSTILFALLLLLYSYSSLYKISKYYKLPIVLFALYVSSFHIYYTSSIDRDIPIFYAYFNPFILVWLCQFGPGASALLLSLILIPISIIIIKSNPDPSSFYHVVSLTSLSIPMLFLMRLEMLNKIKFFLINKKYLEQTRLRYEETKLRYKELGDLSAQVAHDIRSPLSAIMILAKDNPSIPESSRILFRTGVTRILDITNDLLNKAKAFLDSTKEEILPESENSSVLLLTSIIGSIVSEKRVEFRSRLDVQIETNFDRSSFGLFANIQKSELKRILSNIINNAVEAVKDKGRIEISASLLSDSACITIQDNGVGIPADILPKLFKKGATFNKSTNNLGVGLYHANSKIIDWGGSINIDSEVNVGTKVSISLPACVAPKWFASKLDLKATSKIVVLDDDLAIHQVWDKRFSGVQLVHLSTVDEFSVWHQQNNSEDVLYLIDYELLGQSKNGIEIISGFNIQANSVLVTSRSEEQELIDKCISLGIKILPKISADQVPINQN
jgi:signal transduction histidine kinase